MKASQLITNRFSSPSIMTSETRVIGYSVAEWEEALTGGFRKTFAELETKQQLHCKDICIGPATE
ncbi:MULTISPECIES: hypothetical protein [unclassified Duganella]|uniref:hypothetical protein n=1 Tax=unclassified Duganella TaxID=2636909 RepID=UPI00102A44EF|nr:MULTISPECIES: hypothetical protein [unclassified Duganella]